MKMRRLIGNLILLILLTACGSSSDIPSRILIIGNSYVEQHGGMDTHVVGLANSKQSSLSVEGMIIEKGNAALSRHWNNPSTVMEVQEGDWAVVVLQAAAKGRNFLGEYDKENFFEHVRLFHEEAQESGAETILFMYWENIFLNIDTIAADHYEIASELGIKVAPVGFAWQKSLEQRPELELYFSDRVHANNYGNYLAAAVLYATIFEESPEGLPYEPNDFYGEGKISEEDLAYLQKIAWETVMENLESN